MRRNFKALSATFLAVFLMGYGGRLLAGKEPRTALPVAERKGPESNEFLKGASSVGPKACAECHQKEYEMWLKTPHSRMLRKVSPDIVVSDFKDVELTYTDVEALDAGKAKVKIAPTIRLKHAGEDYFLTLVDKDNEANNQTYRMAYVLGGKWEQQFEVEVGSTVFPSPMRWVVADGQWRTKAFSEIWWIADGTADGRPRKPEEMQGNQTSAAKCDGCHTTGAKALKEENVWKTPDKEKWLGITCERCHGPGSKHAELQTKESIVNPMRLNPVQQNQVCGQCHSRVTNKKDGDLAYPLDFLPGNTDLQDRVEFWTYSTRPANFWPNGDSSKNRQQYHDAGGTVHTRRGITCITCHDSHAPVPVGESLRIPADGTCKQCHYEAASMYDESPMAKAGVKCTDCHMAKIANRAGGTKKNKDHWDVSAHTFEVMMPHMAESYKMHSSCDACHAGDERAKYGSMTIQNQDEVQHKLDMLSEALSRSGKGPASLKARNAMNAVLLDGSLGAHNDRKAIELLTTGLQAVSDRKKSR